MISRVTSLRSLFSTHIGIKLTEWCEPEIADPPSQSRSADVGLSCDMKTVLLGKRMLFI